MADAPSKPAKEPERGIPSTLLSGETQGAKQKSRRSKKKRKRSRENSGIRSGKESEPKTADASPVLSLLKRRQKEESKASDKSAKKTEQDVTIATTDQPGQSDVTSCDAGKSAEMSDGTAVGGAASAVATGGATASVSRQKDDSRASDKGAKKPEEVAVTVATSDQPRQSDVISDDAGKSALMSDGAAVRVVASSVATSDATAPAPASRQQDVVQEIKEQSEEKEWICRFPFTADAGKMIALLAGLIAVLVVIHLGPYAPREEAYITCATDGCALYARRLAESVNASAADPCQNFTLFVCDGWHRNNAYSVRQNLTVDALWALAQLAHRVRSPSRGQTAAQRGAVFYRSCVAVVSNERDELPVVKKLLAEANIQWPRRPEQPDVLHTLLHTSIRLRWSPLFNIEIDTTMSYATDVFLMPFDDFQLVASKYVSMKKSTVAERRKYFDILCDEFGASQADQTVVSFEEVEDVMQRMLVPLLESLPNDRKVETISTAWLHRPGAQPSKARWESALAAYSVPNSTVIYETEVLPFVMQFFGLWEWYGEAMTEILVSWCTVQVAALYANRRLITNYYGTRDAALFYQGAFCLSKAYLVAGFSVFDPEGSGHIGSYTLDGVANIAFFVRRSFLKRLQSWQYFEPQRAVVADWDSLSVVFSAASGHGAKVIKDNRSYPDMGESLAENWRDAAVPLGVMQSDAAYAALKSAEYHAVLKHDVVLLPFATAFPQYHPNATEAVNYAGFGKEVALALSRSFLDTYILFEPARKDIAGVSDCMGKTSEASLSNNLEALAVGAAFDAYKNITGDEEIRLVGLEQYSASQIFFIASCYNKCSGSFSTKLEDCNGALKHVEAFSDAFGCPRSSYMNSVRRCHLF